MFSDIVEILAFLVFIYGVVLMYMPLGVMFMGVFLYVVALVTRPVNEEDKDETE